MRLQAVADVLLCPDPQGPAAEEEEEAKRPQHLVVFVFRPEADGGENDGRGHQTPAPAVGER